MRWLPDGSGVLVDGAWRLDPRGGAWSPLAAGAKGASLSPSGKSLAVAEGAQLRTGPLSGPLNGPFEIPRWIEHDDAGGGHAGSRVQTLVVALSEREVLVQQRDVDPLAGVPDACGLWSGSEWRAARGGCLPGVGITAAEAGPFGWVVQQAVAGGKRTLRGGRYDPQRGAHAGHDLATLPESAPVEAHVRADGSGVDIVSACALPVGDGAGECKGPTRHYLAAQGKLRLVHGGLPEGATPDPRGAAGARYAWVKDGQLCVGDAALEPAKARCFPLPASAPPTTPNVDAHEHGQEGGK